MTIYEFDSYKKYLRAVIEGEGRGMVTRLAAAAGCQRSYLSQAISTHVNLTSDQIYNIAVFLQLKEQERELLLLLLEKEKAASFSYKKMLDTKIKQIKKSSKRLSNNLPEGIDDEVPAKYYSAWYYSAIHIATSIESLKLDKHFANYLNLNILLVGRVLSELKSWGLAVVTKDQGWSYSGAGSLHLGDDSVLNRLNHTNWRSYILSSALQPEINLNYTSVFAVSKKDKELLREMLLEFLKNQRSKIANSGSEELVAFTCDFVDLS